MKLADKIKYRLMRWCRSHAYDIVMPNYYMFNYEMDVFKLMQSGYITEYEIKISRSDLKADFKKGTNYTNKHEQLKSGDKANRFYFVVPEGLVEKSEIPSYCGLIFYRQEQDSLRLIQNAKLLHRNKFENYKEMALRLSFREANMIHKLRRNESRVKELEHRLIKFNEKEIEQELSNEALS